MRGVHRRPPNVRRRALVSGAFGLALVAGVLAAYSEGPQSTAAKHAPQVAPSDEPHQWDEGEPPLYDDAAPSPETRSADRPLYRGNGRVVQVPVASPSPVVVTVVQPTPDVVPVQPSPTPVLEPSEAPTPTTKEQRRHERRCRKHPNLPECWLTPTPTPLTTP